MSTAAVPDPAEVRTALRQIRRAHSDQGLGDLLTDVYMVALVAALYGGGSTFAIRRHLAQPLTGPGGDPALRAWLVIGLLLTAGALLWRGLRAVGPLVTTAPAQSWVLATPVDRAGWLSLPVISLLTVGGIVGTGVGVLAAWAGAAASAVWAAVAGAGTGLALAAAAVAVQPRSRHVSRRTSAGVLAAGLLITLGVVVAARSDVRPDAPPVPMLAVAVVALAGAAAAVRSARRALPRLDRAALGGGAQVAGAAVTAAVMLDPTLLSGILTARRWRLAGTVHSRRFLGGPRWWVLIQADIVRVLRRRVDLLTYAGLALVPYTVAVFAPVATGAARILAAYLAVDRLAGGLRMVARTPALRRVLGGTDGDLKLVHLAIPTLGLVVWWWATGWAGHTVPSSLGALLLVGIIGAVYRNATRPPMRYDSNIADTPFGPVPTALLLRLLRGLDVVALLILVDLIVSIVAR